MIGEKVGNYRVLRKIGEGGMGAVYVAEHELLESKVAVKVLLPAFSHDKEVVKRFFNEAKATTSIRHPGIVQVFDLGFLDDGSAYIAMELLEGEPLEDRLKRLSSLPIYEALRVTRHCCSALQAAHSAGIVHRDLKPENIFLVPDPQIEGGERAKILDFGIAKLTDDANPNSVKTRTGSVMGTPMYMSPEQCEGAGNVDYRADIYAMGCVLFHLLAGRPPFIGRGVGEILVAQMRDPAPPVQEFNSSVTPELEALVQRCLAKQPDDRFSSMAEMAEALGVLMGRTGASSSWPSTPVLPAGAMPHAAGATHTGVGQGGHTGSHTGGYGQGTGGVGGHSQAGGSQPRLVTGSTLGAAAAQNFTHGTISGANRSRIAVIGGVALALIIGGGAAAVLSTDDKPEVPILSGVDVDTDSNQANTPPTGAGATGADPALGQTPDQPDEPDEPIEFGLDGAEASDAVPEAPAMVVLTITSEPSGAEVFLPGADESLGVTPFEYETAPSSDDLRLVLRRDGYKDAELTVTPAESLAVPAVELEKERRRVRRPPQRKPPRRDPKPAEKEPDNPLDYR